MNGWPGQCRRISYKNHRVSPLLPGWIRQRPAPAAPALPCRVTRWNDRHGHPATKRPAAELRPTSAEYRTPFGLRRTRSAASKALIQDLRSPEQLIASGVGGLSPMGAPAVAAGRIQAAAGGPPAQGSDRAFGQWAGRIAICGRATLSVFRNAQRRACSATREFSTQIPAIGADARPIWGSTLLSCIDSQYPAGAIASIGVPTRSSGMSKRVALTPDWDE